MRDDPTNPPRPRRKADLLASEVLARRLAEQEADLLLDALHRTARQREGWRRLALGLSAKLDQCEAERDALRARLEKH